MYARLCLAYGWTEVDPLTGVVGPFILKDVNRKYGMINGTTRNGTYTGRPLVDFDAVSRDGIEWLPLIGNISLIPLEIASVCQPESNTLLGDQG